MLLSSSTEQLQSIPQKKTEQSIIKVSVFQTWVVKIYYTYQEILGKSQGHQLFLHALSHRQSCKQRPLHYVVVRS